MNQKGAATLMGAGWGGQQGAKAGMALSGESGDTKDLRHEIFHQRPTVHDHVTR